MKSLPPTDTAAASEAFARLVKIMDELREGCPWDRKQTLESLRHLSIEEVYELSEAILAGNYSALRGELGDLLLHIVFYARIAREEDQFTLPEMIHGLCEKLIRRHPHIYGDVQADSAEQVLQNWEQIKLQEGAKSVLAGVPNGLPAVVKAYRMQEKVASLGFDWDATATVLDKVQEEISELRIELAGHHPGQPLPDSERSDVEAEFGDVLFSLINYARFIGINPEDALERTNRKFKARFEYLEKAATQNGQQLGKMTLEEMDALWDQAKAAGL